MTEPADKQATYDDLLSLPENLVGEILNGQLHAHPRPAPRHAQAYSALGGNLWNPFHKGGAGGPGEAGVDQGAVAVERGEDQGGDRRVVRADLAAHVDPGHPGQHQIQQNQIGKPPVVKDLQGFKTVQGLKNFVIMGRQVIFQHLLIDCFIIDDENSIGLRLTSS